MTVHPLHAGPPRAEDEKTIIAQSDAKQLPPKQRDAMRLPIAALVHLMTQAMLFGLGALIILMTPLAEHAAIAFPVMIVLSIVLGGYAAWRIAPRLRARNWDTRRPVAQALAQGVPFKRAR